MNGFKALGEARMLLDEAKKDGRYPAGVIEVQRPQDRRQGKKRYRVVHGHQLQREISKADRLLGLINRETTDQQVAAMILEEA